LKKFNAKASFFVIGQKVIQNKEIFARIINEGHAVFCHSIDHNYWHYFRSKNHVKNWIANSIAQLNEQVRNEYVRNEFAHFNSKIFRPPAGVITPPLLSAASELNVKLLLWNHRFYDKTCELTKKKCQKSLNKIKKGDILLLHDAQKQKNLENFLKTLEWFLSELSAKKFILSQLPKL
jgi:peptidoglycan/xylan/chitin deacetylase (PgdA/CDA1 family)